jgi:hypothetical protein
MVSHGSQKWIKMGCETAENLILFWMVSDKIWISLLGADWKHGFFIYDFPIILGIYNHPN